MTNGDAGCSRLGSGNATIAGRFTQEKGTRKQQITGSTTERVDVLGDALGTTH